MTEFMAPSITNLMASNYHIVISNYTPRNIINQPHGNLNYGLNYGLNRN